MPSIHVIESPSPVDLLVGRNEGDALTRVLTLGGLSVNYWLATSVETFDQAFEVILSQIEHSQLIEDANIHISAHGSEDGLELTDGDVLEWASLSHRLKGAHERLGPTQLGAPEGDEFDEFMPANLPLLSICLSSCSAYQNFREQAGPEQFYQFLVGPIEDVGWCESLIAFASFYYAMAVQNQGVKPAVQRMNFSVGGPEYAAFELDYNTQLEPLIKAVSAKKS
jgi:hypothetical protein